MSIHRREFMLVLPTFAPALFAGRALARPNLAATLDGIVSIEAPKGFSGSVLVARGQAVLLHKGYGMIGGARVLADSKFWIASAGKQFTATAIMKCRDKGLLALDESLSRFFPSAPKDKQAITVRQLLAHTSGLDQTYASEGAKDRTDAVVRMLTHASIDTPGHAFHYSNDNYQLAAAIVEVVSRRDYKTFVKAELFGSADLRDTGFSGDPGAGNVLPARKPMPARLASEQWGAEGVYSTSGDIFRWYEALHAGRVVSPQSLNDMFSPVAKIGEGAAGLGWFIGRSPAGAVQYFVRGNEDWGPNALLYGFPKSGHVIVVLTHAGDANADSSWSRYILGKLLAPLGL